MAENGESIRSSTTTTSPTATATPPPPPSSTPNHNNHHNHHHNHHYSSCQPVASLSAKVEEGLDTHQHHQQQQQQQQQQRHLQTSPMCNGYSSTSPQQGRPGEEGCAKNCGGDAYSSTPSSPAADTKVEEASCQQQQQQQQPAAVESPAAAAAVVVVKQETDQDGPLDFSLRRRDSVSESFTDDSRASSSLSPPSYVPTPTSGKVGGGGSASSRHSPDADPLLLYSHQANPLLSHPHRHPTHAGQSRHQHHQHHHSHGGGEGQGQGQGHGLTRPHVGRSPASSPDPSESPVGQGHHQPRSAGGKSSSLGGGGGGSRLPPNASLAALGMMAEGTGGGMTPATVAAMLGQNGGMMGPLGGMAPFLGDPRKVQGGNGGKVQRPFKAYPKEALQMPLGYLGLPGINPFASMDQACLQGLSVSQDEIMSIYKQQLEFLKEREKQMMSLGKMMTGSPPSSTSSASSSSSSASSSSSSAALNGSSLAHPLPPPPPSTSAGGGGGGVVGHAHQAPPPPPLTAAMSPSSAPYFSPPSHNASSNAPALPQPPPTSLGYSHSHVPSSTPISSPFPTPTAPPLVSSTSSISSGGSRKRPRTLPESQKDEAYWERRRKNNDAAKRSRDARRAKEDEIAIRAALLEQENLKLRVEVAALKTETARLRCMLYNT